jgi:uncharacterized protein YdeI (YjbR/CyaY-like superfamily)
MPQVSEFGSAEELESWLERNHAKSEGIWLKVAKKGVAGVGYGEALTLALCFGWIDSQKKGLDETHFLQRFTPRRPRGRWSRINRDKAEELLGSDEMTADGLASIEQAKADGRWDRAYEGARTISVPDDLQQALDASPAAASFFATLDGANRYAVLYRVGDCKKPETRARRIETFVAMLARGEKLHP